MSQITAAVTALSASPRAHLLEEHINDRTLELREALAQVEAQKLQLEEALRIKEEVQRQLEIELEDARLLHGVSSMMIDESSHEPLYQRLVDAATAMMRAPYGSLQRYDQATGQLEMIASHGLDEEAAQYWQWVKAGQATTCGKALELCDRVLVPDFETCEFMVGSDDQIAFRKAGVRAAQSTPLLTRGGRLVGMITTHWTQRHKPSERDLRLFDTIARQAADLIERSESLAAMQQHADALREADRYKDEFLATLAHELRNPLAPIRTGLTLLKIGKPGQEERILPMMERQLGHMVRLIDDLLDVSRISRGVVTLKPCRTALSTIIESAIETSRPLINTSNHKFTVTLPGNAVWMNVDETRIAQVISNLLNNAAKYTPPGGKIELIAEPTGSDVIIRVIDNGIGIPEAMLPKIFDLFTQVDRGAERSQSGLGVGLALAKYLTEMHGGSIDVASHGEGNGSIFTLRLPTVEAEAEAELLTASQLGEHLLSTSARILIVDDNVDAAESLQLLLDSMGHRTKIVLESPKAISVAIEFNPDLMILDIGMPHLNGFELAQQIRSHAILKDVYLAALSGWGTEEDRDKSRAAGINCHMTKPIVVEDLESTLFNAARHAGLIPSQRI